MYIILLDFRCFLCIFGRFFAGVFFCYACYSSRYIYKAFQPINCAICWHFAARASSLIYIQFEESIIQAPLGLHVMWCNFNKHLLHILHLSVLLVSVSTASTRHTYMMLMSAFYGNHNWIFRRRKKIHEHLFRDILYLSDRWLFSRHKIIQSKSITYINQNELNAVPNVTIVIVRDFLY